MCTQESGAFEGCGHPAGWVRTTYCNKRCQTVTKSEKPIMVDGFCNTCSKKSQNAPMPPPEQKTQG